MKLLDFRAEQGRRWDEFLSRTAQGVFLHSRQFLTYHGSRFKDVSLMVENESGQLRAVFPAAEASDDPLSVVSHPGLTYGGLLHDSSCGADEVMEMAQAVCAAYRERGYRDLVYKAVPAHLHRWMVHCDLYAVWRVGGVLMRRDLWNVIDLTQPRQMSDKHRRNYQTAAKAGLYAERLAAEKYGEFYSVLSESLRDRHDTAPVHSSEEMVELQGRFPETIHLHGCYVPGGELVAGVWAFKFGAAGWHTQYIATTARGRKLCATDFVVEDLVRLAEAEGVRTFSFGSSTDNAGTRLNAGLFAFKSGFGGGAVVHDFYKIAL